MKRILLSTTAVAFLATVVNAKTELEMLQVQMKQMMKKIKTLESNQVVATNKFDKLENQTYIKSKVPTLKFSGKHYLGFVSSKVDNKDRDNKFETRRNYFQVKAYMNKHDYFRTTFDTHQDSTGDWKIRLKYAYLYLDNILPYTGIEMGQAHRPWIDNEEHGGWNYRSISKVFVEDSNAGHLTNSSDIGFNFKTKLENFSSELGVFNGEGYHGDINGTEVSGEWRLTAHLLGGGTHKAKSKYQYLNISYFGQKGAKEGNLDWNGIHCVYNQPEFLIATQYINTRDGNAKLEGKGSSINVEYRVSSKYNLIGRYDTFKLDKNSVHTNIDENNKERKIYGIGYKYNKNIEFIVNSLEEDYFKDSIKINKNSVMFTAEINW